jgi:hypothetical protein
MTRSKIVKKLDKVFSQYVRLRNANDMGNAKCVTCGKIDHWKKQQCGHFQSRKHYTTRWDEVNCQVQCSGCNVFKYGEQYKFGIYLDQNFGEGTAESLLQKSRQTIKFSNIELLAMIERYEFEIKELHRNRE